MPIKSQNPQKRPLKLGVSKCVAEGVNRTVKVTQPVRETVETDVDTVSTTTDRDHKNHDVVWGPAEHKRPQDDGNSSKCLPGAILRLGLPLTPIPSAAVARAY